MATASSSSSSNGGAHQHGLETFRHRVAAAGIALITLATTATGADGGDVCEKEPSGTASTANTSCAVCHSTFCILMLFSLLLGIWAGALATQAWMLGADARQRASKRKAHDFDIGAPNQYINALQVGGPRKRGLAALQYRASIGPGM